MADPTELDIELGQAALDIIEEFGKEVVFTEPPKPGDFDPGTGKGTPSTPAQDFTRKISPPDKFSSKFVDDDLVEAGDMMAVVANQGLPFKPEPGWSIAFDDFDWKIVDLRPLYSGELIAAYEMQLRK